VEVIPTTSQKPIIKKPNRTGSVFQTGDFLLILNFLLVNYDQILNN